MPKCPQADMPICPNLCGQMGILALFQIQVRITYIQMPKRQIRPFQNTRSRRKVVTLFGNYRISVWYSPRKSYRAVFFDVKHAQSSEEKWVKTAFFAIFSAKSLYTVCHKKLRSTWYFGSNKGSKDPLKCGLSYEPYSAFLNIEIII